MSYNKYVCDSSFTLNPTITLSIQYYIDYDFNIKKFNLGFDDGRSITAWDFSAAELDRLLVLAEKFELNSSIVIGQFKYSIKEFDHQNRPSTIEFVVGLTHGSNTVNQDFTIEIQDITGCIKYVKDFMIQAQNFEIL